MPHFCGNSYYHTLNPRQPYTLTELGFTRCSWQSIYLPIDLLTITKRLQIELWVLCRATVPVFRQYVHNDSHGTSIKSPPTIPIRGTYYITWPYYIFVVSVVIISLAILYFV